jgi:hypothetical protein
MFHSDAFNALMKNAFKFPKKPGTVVERDSEGNYPKEPVVLATEALQVIYAVCLKHLVRQVINYMDMQNLHGSSHDNLPKDNEGRTVFSKNIRIGRWELVAAIATNLNKLSREEYEYAMVASNLYKIEVTVLSAEFSAVNKRLDPQNNLAYGR